MEFMSSEESEEDEEETRTGPPKRHIKPLQLNQWLYVLSSTTLTSLCQKAAVSKQSQTFLTMTI